MSDFSSALPIRTELTGQSVYEDVIIKLGDATNPTTQQASVDIHGSQSAIIRDTSGNAIGDQNLSSSYWLQVVEPTNGPVAPGTAASFSSLIGGTFHTVLPTLSNGQQSSIQLDSSGRLIISPLTSSSVVTVSNFPTTVDTNYGTVGNNTIRTAAQIGNATGAADFGAGTTDAQTLRVVLPTDQTAIPVTQSGSWTVAVTQSTSPWVTKDQSDGPVAPGTAASFSQLGGGVYNSTPPTLTNGQQAALQLDSSGRLIVDAVVTFPYDENWGTVGATTLRTAAQIGNAAGAADFNNGATGAQTLRVAANQGAPNTTANAWPTKLTDGTNTASITAAGEVKVDVTQPLPAGSNTIGSVGVTNLPTTVDTNYGVVGVSTLRSAAQIGNATGAADFNNGATGAQTLRVAANLAVGGANVSGTNPVPVSLSSAPLGTPVNNYNMVAAVAANATSNHVYTITALKTFQGKKIWATASGALKIEVQVSPDGSTYSTLWVGFNSTATPNITIDLDELVFLESGTGATIQIIRTNEDKKPMDVYSTISGTEV